jgi:hypothetical protein
VIENFKHSNQHQAWDNGVLIDLGSYGVMSGPRGTASSGLNIQDSSIGRTRIRRTIQYASITPDAGRRWYIHLVSLDIELLWADVSQIQDTLYVLDSDLKGGGYEWRVYSALMI